MPIPAAFEGRLSIPAVAAPMFVTSGPDLVVEACRAGIVGTFPALNQRTSEGYEAWLVEIRERLDKIERDTGKPCAPFGVNLIVHKSNPRVHADLELSVKHKVPLIITSLGKNIAPAELDHALDIIDAALSAVEAADAR